MLIRIISGVIFVIVMLGIIWPGGIVTAAGLTIVSIIAYSELIRATGVRTEQGRPCIFEVVGSLVIILYYGLIYLRVPESFLFLSVILYMIILMLLFVLTYPHYNAKQVLYSYSAFVYGPVMLSCALMSRLLMREGEHGMYHTGFFTVWMIFISAWASDTFAYFAGVTLGKHKIAPTLSPKKSIEGCIGGVVGATLAGLLYGYVLMWTGHGEFGKPTDYMLLGGAGSIVAQIGDLAASGIKRCFNVKDFGTIIPGHGGVMDRFDSVLFTAPIIYLLSLVVFL